MPQGSGNTVLQAENTESLHCTYIFEGCLDGVRGRRRPRRR